MLGVSVFSPAISFARSALVEKARAAVERAAVANGRLTASLSAIVCVFGRADCAVQQGVAGDGVVRVSMILTFSKLACQRRQILGASS